MNMECFLYSLNIIEVWCVKILLKMVGYIVMIGNFYDIKYIFVYVLVRVFLGILNKESS